MDINTALLVGTTTMGLLVGGWFGAKLAIELVQLNQPRSKPSPERSKPSATVVSRKRPVDDSTIASLSLTVKDMKSPTTLEMGLSPGRSYGLFPVSSFHGGAMAARLPYSAEIFGEWVVAELS